MLIDACNLTLCPNWGYSLIASILEISQFAQFIVGDKCDEINVLLAKYANSLLDGMHS